MGEFEGNLVDLGEISEQRSLTRETDRDQPPWRIYISVHKGWAVHGFLKQNFRQICQWREIAWCILVSLSLISLNTLFVFIFAEIPSTPKPFLKTCLKLPLCCPGRVAHKPSNFFCEVRKDLWAFSFWLRFSGADWLGRQTLITWCYDTKSG